MKYKIAHSVLNLAIVAIFVTLANSQACWKDSYYRGVGVLSLCLNPLYPNLISGACYPNCPTGYVPGIPLTTNIQCVQVCPFYFTDGGTTCSQTYGTYGRTAGYVSNSACLSANPSCLDPTLGCETNLLLHYPKCANGYHNVLCCVCASSGNCPAPLIGAGPPCTKFTYNRIGVASICSPGLVKGTDGLCYPACINGYDGDSTCWQTACPASAPYICNTALCTPNAACSPTETTETTNVLNAITTSVSTGQFTMESIVRGLGAATQAVGAGVCFQQTIPAIDAQRAIPYACMDRRFPIFLGSIGATKFETIELDINGNIGIAGKSTDVTLITASNNIFVGVLPNTGFNFTWIQEFNLPTQHVYQIVFDLQGSQMMSLFSPGPIKIILFNAQTGSITQQLDDMSSQFSGSSFAMKLDPSTGIVYLAASDQSAGPQLTLLALNLFNNPTQSSFTTIKVNPSSTSSSIPYSLAIQSGGMVFVGSQSSIPQPPPSGGQTQCFTITNFAITTGLSPSYQSTIYNGIGYIPRELQYSSSFLFLVAEGIPTVSYGLKINKYTLPLTSTNSYQTYIYQECITEYLQVLDLVVIDQYNMQLLFKNQNRNTILILQILWAGTSVPSGSIQITQKKLHKPDLSFSQLMTAKVMPNGEAYIGGYLGQYSTCIPNLGASGISTGFLAYSLSASLCDTFSWSIGNSYQVPLTSTSTNQVYTFPSSITNTNLVSSTPVASAIPGSKIYKVINTCCYVTVTTSSIPPNQYIIDYPPAKYTYPPFVISPCTDLHAYTFWYYQTSVPPIPVNPVSPPIFFDDYNLTFLADTLTAASPPNNLYPTTATYGTTLYSITVHGTLPNHQVIDAAPISITLFNIPPTTTIQGFPVPTITYIVTQKAVNITWPGFVSSDPTYYIIYYLEVQAGSYSRAIDTQLFNFTQGQRNELIQVYTKDNSKSGVYFLRIVGKFTPNTPFQAVEYFKVAILHQCFLTEIIPADFPESLVFQIQMNFPQPLVYQFPKWTEMIGICAPFTYKATLSNGNPLPNFIQFNPNMRQFSVQQTANMMPSQNVIQIKGFLESYHKQGSAQMQIIVNCNVAKLQSVQQNQVISYVVGSPPMMIQIAEFQQSPSCYKEIQYSARLDNGQKLPEKYLSFNDFVSDIGLHEMILTLKVQDDPKVNNFTVIITALVQKDTTVDQQAINATLNITFNLVKSTNFIQTEYPPIFLLIKQGEQKVIFFGAQSNSSNTTHRELQIDSQAKVVLNKFQLKYVSGQLSDNSVILVPTTDPPTVLDQKQGTLIISPQHSSSNDRYIIKTIIQDQPGVKYRILQSIVIIIYKSDGTLNEAEIQKQQAEMLDLLYKTEAQYQKSGLASFDQFNVTNTTKNGTQLKIRIDNVDENSIVSLKFNNPVFIITNLTLIDNQVLQLFAQNSYQTGLKRNLNFTWKAISMTNYFLYIQLYFKDALSVSIFEVILFQN